MATSFRPDFSPSDAREALLGAIDQMRSEFDKRVGVRVGRGDVRAAVLALLHEKPMHGYQIIREISQRTQGRWKPSAGSVYPTLQMLADEGVVRVDTDEERKVYALTDAGRDEAASAATSVPWADGEDCETPGMGAVPKAGFDLAQAALQVARAGTSAQQEEAVEVLKDARRKIYSILAQD